MSILLSNISKNFGHFPRSIMSTWKFPKENWSPCWVRQAAVKPHCCASCRSEQPDSGRVLLNGEDKTQQHASHRGIGFVFQHYALFRHMTVFDNIAFRLRVKTKKERPSEADIRQKGPYLTGTVQLDWLHDRFPDQLSGGQRQRIAWPRSGRGAVGLIAR